MLSTHAWLACNYTAGFDVRAWFKSIDKPYHEGLVHKDLLATLAICGQETARFACLGKTHRPVMSADGIVDKSF
jgi:hypothetical protein